MRVCSACISRAIVPATLCASVFIVGCAPASRPSHASVDAAPTPTESRTVGPDRRTPSRTTPATPDADAQMVDRIGTSVSGRPIEATTIAGGSESAASSSRILLIGTIHGDEPEGGRTIRGVEAYLRTLRPEATVRIVRDINPDGTEAGTRANAAGVDLNRNWPARNFRPGRAHGEMPLSEPETRVLHDEIERFDPEVVVVLHSARRGPFVNYDGPAAELAEAFARAAAETDPRWRVVPDMGYPTPGSLGSYLGVDRGVPILTIEFARGHDSGAAWGAMRDGLGAVLREATPAQ